MAPAGIDEEATHELAKQCESPPPQFKHALMLGITKRRMMPLPLAFFRLFASLAPSEIEETAEIDNGGGDTGSCDRWCGYTRL